jgi:hypothetical protein
MGLTAGQRVGVEQAQARLAHGARHVGHAALGRVLPVGVAHEGRGRRAGAVERHMGAALAHAHQGLGAGGDDGVAAQDQVGRGRTHARGADLVLAARDQHMAPGRAALLRQARGVLGHDALALQVRGHAEQLAYGDHAGATHARDHDAPGTAV